LPVTSVDSYAVREARGGVRIAADPFLAPERAADAFAGGEDFGERGLLAVRVLVENGGSAEIRLDPVAAQLTDVGGRSRPALRPEDAFAVVKLPVGWWAVGAGFVGGSAQASRNEARRRTIEERALRPQAVAAGAAAHGFLYFQLDGGETKLEGMRLRVPVLEGGGRELAFDLALRGRGDAPPGAAEKPGRPKVEDKRSRGVIIRSPAP
jgi:hypothetical protein